MTPFARAAEWHLAHCPGQSFRDVLEAHFQVGHVVSSPEIFLLGRRVSSWWCEQSLRDPWFTDEGGDTWHVWLFAGALPKVLAAIPYPLPYVTFDRRGRLRRYLLRRILLTISS